VTRTHRAVDTLPIDVVLARLPERMRWMSVFLQRISKLTPIPETGVALDIGAAQGLNLAALNKLGWEAVGIEPSEQAIAASAKVARQSGTDFQIVHGVGEDLPFPAETFDLVLAQSVLEHVTDPLRVFQEAGRVLRPGGVFFFHTTNALSPRQSEIAGFPLFPWYPPSLRRTIMRWAMVQRPELVGYTDHPAFNWFTPWQTRRLLRKAGFAIVFDHWEMKREDDVYLSPKQKRLVSLIASRTALRVAGDVFVKSSAYLAVKQNRDRREQQAPVAEARARDSHRSAPE
jgi:SAM-dependent methyltransferase